MSQIMFDRMFARDYLQKELEARKKRNQLYSLRAFARDLDISPSNLSEFLSAKRDFSQKNSLKVAQQLDLSQQDFERFMLSCQYSFNDDKNAKETWSKLFHIMSHWYYFAILNFAKKGVVADPVTIAKRLAIKEKEAKEAINDLCAMGFVEIHQGKLCKKESSFKAATKIPALAIIRHHKSLLAQAGLSYFKDPIPLRDMRSLTIPMDPELIPRARELLLECRKKIEDLMTSKKSESLYILSYFLFPVDKKNT